MSNIATHPIKEIILGSSKYSQKGVCSVCSASDFVIEAALLRAKETNTVALIEATANQVNQFGGYTGMRAKDFVCKVHGIADTVGIGREQVVLGGDHLGPFPWRYEDEEPAMEKSAQLIAEFVEAGFSKIHIDTSMRLGSDGASQKLSDETIAERAALLARAASGARQPGREYVFVLGSEVPVPGGTAEVEDVSVTSARAFREVHDCFAEVFLRNGLDDVWRDVVAFVVQPGVEFSDMGVTRYDRSKARELCSALVGYPGICFEGHSTDYQTEQGLREMVEDGIRILKVGPALTFYQREALFALEMVEKELLAGRREGLSGFSQVLEEAMVGDPGNWKNYYSGSEGQLKLLRRFSLSDRCRYYLSKPEVAGAAIRLMSNLSEVDIPYSVLSQYMPVQAALVHSGEIGKDAKSLVLSRISNCIDGYLGAVSL
ncbi:MAG: class II D-tagatose-bisphosphate aldolase, non-catalytic subunit [Clostridiales bacterium]|nr:class II D-tagatose-bisphosphate aldolase, non-catalytic subunit [Clostridiales bacterium]